MLMIEDLAPQVFYCLLCKKRVEVHNFYTDEVLCAECSDKERRAIDTWTTTL